MHGADADRGTTLGKLRLDLDQGDVPLLGNQPIDEAAVRLDPARVAVTTATLGKGSTMLKRKVPPADRARGADTKIRRCRSAPHAAVNRSDNPLSQVL
jgi:hypothetical protein